MNTPVQCLLENAEETRAFAESLAPALPPNTLIALYGDLGAGKTTFVQGLVRGLGSKDDLAQSPTFTYMHTYPCLPTLTHFDLYRLVSPDDFLSMGFHESFETGGIVAIEWPERISNLLPPSHLEIRLTHVSETTRKLEMRWI